MGPMPGHQGNRPSQSHDGGVVCSLTSGGGVHAVVRVVVADVSVAPASRPLPVDDRLGSTLGRLRRPHQRHDQDEQR